MIYYFAVLATVLTLCAIRATIALCTLEWFADVQQSSEEIPDDEVQEPDLRDFNTTT